MTAGCGGHEGLEERWSWRFAWDRNGKKGILRILGVHQTKHGVLSNCPFLFVLLHG